jgi:hypothetical protein
LTGQSGDGNKVGSRYGYPARLEYERAACHVTARGKEERPDVDELGAEMEKR